MRILWAAMLASKILCLCAASSRTIPILFVVQTILHVTVTDLESSLRGRHRISLHRGATYALESMCYLVGIDVRSMRYKTAVQNPNGVLDWNAVMDMYLC